MARIGESIARFVWMPISLIVIAMKTTNYVLIDNCAA